MKFTRAISPASTVGVLTAATEAAAFIDARQLPVTSIEVLWRAPGYRLVTDGHGGAVSTPRPAHGECRVSWLHNPEQILAWARAIGATTARVTTENARTVIHFHGQVGNVVYRVGAELPHTYGDKHLPGAGIIFDAQSRKHGIVTIDGIERSLRTEGHLPATAVNA